MKSNKLHLIVAAIMFSLTLPCLVNASYENSQAQRKIAAKLYKDGNYKDAFDVYKDLALDINNNPRLVGNDMNLAIGCLNAINNQSETDEFREEVIKKHSSNWRLLSDAAKSYLNANHYGYIISGTFQRGPHRGGGSYVSSLKRDRVRALQLMHNALNILRERDPAIPETGTSSFYESFASMIIGYRGYNESWRLQYLSDLSKLPAYTEGYSYQDSSIQGAPVKSDDTPVFYSIPESFESAQNDGERWRWLLHKAALVNPKHRDNIDLQYANFLHQQFGVQTMVAYNYYFSRYNDEEEAPQTYNLHTLRKTETLAKLATGIKRFPLPEKDNFITIYERLAESSNNYVSTQSLETLAHIFENRRQYNKAVQYWEEAINKYGAGNNNYRRKQLEQITGNWGRFEPVMTHPAGKEATVEYLFRNGSTVKFQAQKIKTQTLLDDVKNYLKSNPSQLDWKKINIANIGHRIVTQNEQKYLGRKVAEWQLETKPRPDHFDKRITVTTPLKKAGAYLLTAEMQGGNTSKIIIWIDDTVIVKKQLNKKTYFFVADAVSGKPIPGINLEFFGYRQEYLGNKILSTRKYDVFTTNFAEFTDKQGQVIPASDDMTPRYQWLISATSPNGRFAFMGFNSIWYNNYYDREYNQKKVFGITDRPVYRPGQSSKFKFWIRHVQYDQDNKSIYANDSFRVIITNPKNEKVFEKSFKADEFGGIDGNFTIPEDAPLGQYNARVIYAGNHTWGNVNFRVEEYKKPEFEVTLTPPDKPVMLGEKISAKISANYYFGAPVTQAKVKYKVLRYNYRSNWYPPGIWDWFYGPGYWWFAYDYDWYPGWKQWGCIRPFRWWMPPDRTPPEVVAEAETCIGTNGTIDVNIDTTSAKELHGNIDHKYVITAEVTDASRRTIVGKGTVLVARKPFKVYAWVDRGYYHAGDSVIANFSARTIDNKPFQGNGKLSLLSITYKDGKPVETPVQEWNLKTDKQGLARMQMTAAKAGQYRISYKVTDVEQHVIEGGYVFSVRGKNDLDIQQFKFNQIELIPDKNVYSPGDTVNLMINTEHANSTVLLFTRPVNGTYLEPEILTISGKSIIKSIPVTKKDMPNFFVEAITINNGKLYTETKEIIVPPQKRVLNVEVQPSATKYKPGEKAVVRVKVTDISGKPYAGTTVMSVYDKAVEYISGGSNIQDIKSFFWKWRRTHHPNTLSSLNRYFSFMSIPKATTMQSLGVFGKQVADDLDESIDKDDSLNSLSRGVRMMKTKSFGFAGRVEEAAPASLMAKDEEIEGISMADQNERAETPATSEIQPTVRRNFADTAFWKATLNTDDKGFAEVSFDMPENLSGWKIKTWALGHGTVVGEGSAEVVTSKDILIRLQAPRFFIEKDEVTLSANIHNYLETDKAVRAVLEMDGNCLKSLDKPVKMITVKANGEQRVDWRIKVVKEGESVVRMKALTDKVSDAIEMKFPVYIHGMLRTESFCNVIRKQDDSTSFTINVPESRRINDSRLEIRFSPTLSGAMVDALPYMVNYPYGCTEQTLNRFLPTVITLNILKSMNLDLEDIRNKRSNLNPQEIGDDHERAGQWKHWNRNPVFEEDVVKDMVKKGLKRLTAMQLSDGGWGWFSGYGEHSSAHTTATVVHGLQIAQRNHVAIVPGLLEKGVSWLEKHQQGEIIKLKNAANHKTPWKEKADNLDAFVFMTLTDADKRDTDMYNFLYRDKNSLSVCAKAMYGLALYKLGDGPRFDKLLRNVEQHLQEDNENQTAWLNLPNSGYWWYWYGGEMEAHAYYLKMLNKAFPTGPKSSRLVKYILNNRKHSTYWNSTRDTALCIEALAGYFWANREYNPDMTVEIYMDDIKQKEVHIGKDNLFRFDNKLVLTGKSITSGLHKIELKRKGTGPVYANAYLSIFTLEDNIKPAGLEIKVHRKYYKLVPANQSIKVAGSHGQALDQKIVKYERQELKNLSTLKSGDLVEIELEIESKNDYEYLIFEDMKASGFEPIDLQSGYNNNSLGAYMELRDERVCFFVRSLARGKHSVSYRMRAEIPGKFSALPTKAHAMYAPELKANSEELKINIVD